MESRVWVVLSMIGAVSSATDVPGRIYQNVTSSSLQIAGAWRLNKEASRVEPGGTTSMPRDPVAQGRGDGFRGRGGRGGPGFGDGRGSGGGAPNEKNQAKIQALMHEVTAPPDRMAILIKNDLLTIAEGTGAVRRFPINGRRADVEFGAASIETHTTWKGTTLSQELKAGEVACVRTYELASENSAQLIVTMTMSGDARGGRSPAKFIYDRE